MNRVVIVPFLFFLIYARSTAFAGVIGSNVAGSTALDNYPLVDGHNDLPYNLYTKLNDTLKEFRFENNLINDTIFGSSDCSCHTDLPRLKQGKVGAQFWVAYVDCTVEKEKAVAKTLDQIDVIKRLINKYPNDLEFVTTSDGILEAFKRKKIASLIAVEGGHSIDNRLSILRLYYELGVRYLTLTHTCNLEWAESAEVDKTNSTKIGLTGFGKKIVLEMNRLGMLVDLSHVSAKVMHDAIDVSRAPTIFSHSSARAVYDHVRNVADDVLLKVKRSRGIVMVNFFSYFIRGGNATIRDVVNHINHIVDIAGVDSVGIGSDYDGVPVTPIGLENVSKYPDLFDLLRKLDPNRWTIENLEKLAGRNFIRVFKEVERVKQSLKTELPAEDLLGVSNEI
ncbi:dipeptidase 1-like [Anoplophora glabripennis]|uniref:dipeptidase 1-like n=1 Tax=Anoplophora glabripennis TaxID=217634 RepID=UPI000874E4AB|nr:dipeptidase 1-like [Anoplophora glabripennis]